MAKPIVVQERDAIRDEITRLYTKGDLVEMVTEVMMKGYLPKPLLTPDIVEPGTPGRPPREVSELRRQRLIALIQEAYPDVVDLRWLAANSKLALKTVRRLQGDFEFFLQLGPPYAEFFRELPSNVCHRMTSTWRALLDVHLYLEALKNPAVRLPFYQTHVMLRTAAEIRPLVGTSALNKRNRNEMHRLRNPQFMDLMVRAGYDKLPAFSVDYDDVETDFACMNYCSLLNAWLEKANVYRTDIARDILGLDNIPMVKLPLYIKTGDSSLEIVKQILGVT